MARSAALTIASCLVSLSGLAACGAEAQPNPDLVEETNSVAPAPADERGAQPTIAETTRERLSRNSDDLVVEQLPNGMTKVDLRGRFQQAAVARVGSDGKLERSCVDSPEALDRWMQAPGSQPSNHPGPVIKPKK